MSTPETHAQGQGSATEDNGAGPRDTLSVTDNRTGKTYELPITDSTVRAIGLAPDQGRSDDEFGLLAYDPAFMNTASCRSSITYIDGDAGILQHRGYPIEQLCEHSTYLEVAYLLINGGCRRRSSSRAGSTRSRSTRSCTRTSRTSCRASATTRTRWACWSRRSARCRRSTPTRTRSTRSDVRAIQIIRLLAKMPTLAAFAFRHNMGQPYVYPDNDLDYAGNFLGMMYKMTELKYQPDPRLERALDVLFILHADHEQNASTSAVRSVGSTQVDPYSAVAAGSRRCTGRCTAAPTRRRCGCSSGSAAVENIPDFLEGVKAGNERLMGFGHRVYKNYDPRARIIRKYLDDVFEVRGMSPLLRVATELEKRALDDDYFTSRKLYPNVDFYSGLIYEALGLPVAMFPVMFAIGRTSGWIAQWLEMVQDPEQKIARPRQIYTGERDRDYVPIEQPLGGRGQDRQGRSERSVLGTRDPAHRAVCPRSEAPRSPIIGKHAAGAMPAVPPTSRRGGAASRGPRGSGASDARPGPRSAASGRGSPGGRPRAR